MNNGFEDFYNVLDDFFTPRSLERSTFKLDVQEDEKQYTIEAEMPGVKKDEISLNLEEGRLNISVKHEENTEDAQKNYLHRERRVSSMSRAIYLADAKADDIKAKLDDGVLTISVLKQDKRISSKSIEIE
ncbi:MAG: Hsp20/alpha crystallin family protein [Clostridiales bacterium]|nr:Hsp20/alpha crystallin family protein [Clostridiales bacterium]